MRHDLTKHLTKFTPFRALQTRRDCTSPGYYIYNISRAICFTFDALQEHLMQNEELQSLLLYATLFQLHKLHGVKYYTKMTMNGGNTKICKEAVPEDLEVISWRGKKKKFSQEGRTCSLILDLNISVELYRCVVCSMSVTY
jgi:hypothetical protein